MPHINVKLYPGRSEQQKARFAQPVALSVVSALECSEGSVSVAIEEIPPGDWAEQVYKPEILDKPQTLYKQPGYNPFQS